jgi:hypothetical protein
MDRILESVTRSETSEFILSVDSDDSTDYSWAIDNSIKMIRHPNRSMNEALNNAALTYSNQFEFLTFMGDDHVARTNGWDTLLIESISDLSFGLAFGDDLIAGESLPTSVVLSSSLVLTLGYMTPPSLKHMYLDNFWLDLGRKTGRIRYVPNVIIEHMHHSVGKSEFDVTYSKTNKHAKKIADGLRYACYKKFTMPHDIFKLKVLEKKANT